MFRFKVFQSFPSAFSLIRYSVSFTVYSQHGRGKTSRNPANNTFFPNHVNGRKIIVKGKFIVTIFIPSFLFDKNQRFPFGFVAFLKIIKFTASRGARAARKGSNVILQIIKSEGSGTLA